MWTLTTVCAAALACVAILCIERYLNAARRGLLLPPGPPGLPWIGNVVGIDVAAPWLTYCHWGKTYGDLVYTRFFGKDVIIINSEKVARDLFENRSRNYAGRPYLRINEPCGVDFNSGFLPYGETWRLHRRFFQQTFKSDAVPRFRPLHVRKSCLLAQQLLKTPDQFIEHVFDYTASIIMNCVYDYDPSSSEDELLKVVENVIGLIMSIVRPDVAFIVDTFPVVLSLPSWLPGMSFKKKMAVANKLVGQYVERPFEYAVQKMLNDGPAPSMVHDSMRKAGPAGADEEWMKELKGAAASAFLGGAETTNSVILTFILAMALNPEVQEKAQAEIDRVLGDERLPALHDRPSLPYVDALLRELNRYSPIVPLAIPHLVMDDDVYCGFHIPKDAIVFTNLWSMTRDESKFPNPDAFVPERFLADDGSLLPDDTEHHTFGFGRRICPGRHFADASVWSAIAVVLAVFRISKRKDERGVEIPVEAKFPRGLVRHPLPFVCSIVPRTSGMDAEKLEELIAATTIEH